MGSRDSSIIDDERADAAMQRVLAHTGEPTTLDPPPDLVTRSLRALPGLAPQAAAKVQQRRQRRRLVLWSLLGLLSLLVLLLGVAGLGNGAGLAPLAGDGSSGLSRVLLALALLVKPFARLVTTSASAGLLFVPLVLAAMWLWWRLLRPANPRPEAAL